MTDVERLDAYDLIPKVELHCHVEGSVRPSTVVELARKAGRPLPVEDPAELYSYDSLDSFLAVFWLIQETLGTSDDWARIAYESLVDAAAHGLRYREMFFTPARHMAVGQRLEAIVAGLTEGSRAPRRPPASAACSSPTSTARTGLPRAWTWSSSSAPFVDRGEQNG